MKRWRSLLRLLQPFLGEGGRRLRMQARDFARELSGARDAQAAMEALDDLLEAGADLSPRTIASIRSRLDEIRLAAEASTLTQAVRARLIVGLDSAGAAVDAWALEHLTFPDVARELTKSYRRVGQAAHAKAAQRLGGRLLAERPKAFRRRIEALWEQSRR